ncbi:DNA segregation ATPase FtsK/SpoIIIE, S-DNA-T family [Blastococcus aurantiacus]|uniref:DNA segregation ATPase FtsK/SpoIIIE, S-DNA-T family n=1 Tax=Blastococcus aurantiacus TaxID=1550231 RepID=A0A1G7KYA9_9ACTN|nr:FtsK/SpoIIIE domain-containing protein [Blastococcus aurantiacus]SDF41860.1 DNA segregation ATPase FtsK/SpoIIIE, S-DNA-T family [Blastococcus aurantiacus]
MTPPPAPDDRPARSSRVWTLRGDEGVVDVEVTAGDDHRVADVLPLLRRTLGVPVPGLWSGPARLAADAPLSSAPLRHGALLGLGPPKGPSATARGPLELQVTGGPDAGRALALDRGPHVVGRGDGCSVQIPDPDISRRHLEIRVGEGAVEVRDLGSTNGSLLDDAPLDGVFRPWPPGSRLRLGATSLAVSGTADPPAVLEAQVGGRTVIRPLHRLRVLHEEREVSLPRPPAEVPRRRLAWVAVLLPAVGGVLLAWLLRTPTFLFFALLSPLVALGTWASDRWSGRRSTRRERAAYREDLAAARGRLDDAVREDVLVAEGEHPDPATVAAAVRRRSAQVWSRGSTGTDPLVIRLGTGPGAVRVTRREEGGRPEREVAEHVPVCVDLTAAGGLAMVGPRAQALGAMRAVLAQLTALHPPDALGLVLLTSRDRVADWTWARWLPHLPAGAAHAEAEPSTSSPGAERSLRTILAGVDPDRTASAPRAVVVVDRQVDGRTAALLRVARDVGVLVLTTAERPGELPVAVDASLTLAGETASTGLLAQDRAPDRTAVLVDRISAEVASELARDLADLVPASSGAALPREVRLLELPDCAIPDPADAAAGRWSDARNALRTTLGRSADGPVVVDLCRDGPHALVAGTTGSGKSELLQSLIAGLALNHPPDRCSFLLVDYKGGAAFADAAGLPHTVGMLTDLDGSTTARALRSLSAELSSREALLAAHGVSDLAALPATVALARLVIVVDEFATLAEELPGFVPGLVGIAQRGRSLGIHLVLATQRPGGVVSPEIRANCTLRICLRTTDEADSRDVVGTPAAAHLPVHAPGRALLRRGSGEPRTFQAARVAVPVPSAPEGPEVRLWVWPGGNRPGRRAATGATDLSRLVDALSRSAEARGTAAPHRPWQPPLPDIVRQADLDATAPGPAAEQAGARLRIGLVDRPDRQAQEPLELDLTAGGGVLAVGGPRSGRTTLLRSVLRSATARLGPGELHVHVLETAGGALCAEAAALPHAGTTISGADAFRTVRLLDRLNREVDARRTAPPGSSAPLVLVLVDGVEAAGALLDEAEPGRGSDGLLRLVRDGAAVGVTCVLTADRALPGGRLAAAARMRLLLPLPDRADYAVAGVTARAVPTHRPPGRALLGEDALECQLALPPSTAPRTVDRPGTAASAAPLCIADLPADPVLPPDVSVPDEPSGRGCWLAVGPGGDDGALLGVDLHRTGGLLVIGPPRSGRTTALESFARRLAASGGEVARLSPPHAAPEGDASQRWLDATDPEAVLAWAEGLRGRRGILLADDLGPSAEYSGIAALPRTGIVLLAAGSSGQLTGHYQGPVAALRRARTGLLLRPGPADAETVGIRLPRLPVAARPGSGWLVTDGAAQRVQVARTPPDPAPGR